MQSQWCHSSGALGGEPFAPPHGESGATGKAPQGRQCAWLGSRTLQSPCLDLWHPAKPMRRSGSMAQHPSV